MERAEVEKGEKPKILSRLHNLPTCGSFYNSEALEGSLWRIREYLKARNQRVRTL